MIDDYTPWFQNYLNNITEKNPPVDRDYTIADLAFCYTIGCLRQVCPEVEARLTDTRLAGFAAICCGSGALWDDTLWLEKNT